MTPSQLELADLERQAQLNALCKPKRCACGRRIPREHHTKACATCRTDPKPMRRNEGIARARGIVSVEWPADVVEELRAEAARQSKKISHLVHIAWRIAHPPRSRSP